MQQNDFQVVRRYKRIKINCSRWKIWENNIQQLAVTVDGSYSKKQKYFFLPTDYE